MSDQVRYDAFISYRHCSPDKEITENLHKALENFRLPHALSKKVGKRKLERVFRDEAELAVNAELSEEIERIINYGFMTLKQNNRFGNCMRKREMFSISFTARRRTAT